MSKDWVSELQEDAFDKATNHRSRAAIIEVIILLHAVAIVFFSIRSNWVALVIFSVNLLFVIKHYYDLWAKREVLGK